LGSGKTDGKKAGNDGLPAEENSCAGYSNFSCKTGN
jgi:hypothetical protein